ncbi:MAG: DUF5132 domain-containing protein [Anaerolineae bacterium]
MELLENYGPGLAIGAGTVVVGSTLFRRARPVIKTVVKAGMILATRVRHTVAETQEQFGDLIAEARSELSKPAETPRVVPVAPVPTPAVERPKKRRKPKATTILVTPAEQA